MRYSHLINVIIFFNAYLFQTNAIAEKFTTEFIKITTKGNEQKIKNTDCKNPKEEYEIGKYETSNIEYTAFLNSVARISDPYNLYSSLAESHFWGGIVRIKNKKSHEWNYYVKEGYELLPVTFVSWMDAARFVNWLHYGRPNTGLSEIGTTEGNENFGAYNTTAETPKSRNLKATYFLPTCGEWIFSGFYDPISNSYLNYTGSNTPPESASYTSQSRTANYYSHQWANKYPHIVEINRYKNNPSPWGTLNQSGNVMEWTETGKSENKIALGGSAFLPLSTINYNYWDSELPNKKISSFGIRVARKSQSTEKILTFTAESIKNTKQIIAQSNSSNEKINLPEWIKISHPGNLSDYRTGRGCVPYEFEIQTTEITNSQYADFLNSVAKSTDEYKLFVPDMMFGVVGGINKIRKGDGFEYHPKNKFENRPVTYLSWFSLARYANWLHYGKPIGNQGLGITEGTEKIGAYNTQNFTKFSEENPKKISNSLFRRNKEAIYFIPNDDEWYKTAYYDPNKKGIIKYWKFPSKSDTPPPNKKLSRQSSNFQKETLGEGPPFFVSEVADYPGSGFFNVYDMGGNVWEWIEDWKNISKSDCWRCDTPTKGLRGGSFNYIDIGLNYKNIDPGNPSDHYFVYGGRIARFASTELAWCSPYDSRVEAYSLVEKLIRYKSEILPLTSLLVAIIFFWGHIKKLTVKYTKKYTFKQ